jgi:hypothetical protein
MALRPTKPKKKKNPFRLSSDRQPEIEKANQRKRSRRYGGPPGIERPPKRMNPLGPRKGIPPGMGPYKPFPKKGIEEFLKGLEERKKKTPRLKLTPTIREKLKRLKEQLKRKS